MNKKMHILKCFLFSKDCIKSKKRPTIRFVHALLMKHTENEIVKHD